MPDDGDKRVLDCLNVSRNEQQKAVLLREYARIVRTCSRDLIHKTTEVISRTKLLQDKFRQSHKSRREDQRSL